MFQARGGEGIMLKSEVWHFSMRILENQGPIKKLISSCQPKGKSPRCQSSVAREPEGQC